jgi:c-di-GMP-binding flagellar brake protein YcgR
MADNPFIKPDSPSEAFSQSGTVEIITQRHEMLRILNRMEQKFCRLTARLDDEAKLHSSLILSVDEDKETLLLDNLTPSITQKHLNDSQRLHLQANYLGVGARFTIDTHCIQITAAGWRIPLPKTLHHQQRRSFYRVEFPPRDQPVIELYIEARQIKLRARLQNLSAGGCAIKITQSLSVPLTDGERGTILHMLLDGQQLIKTAVTIRSPITRPQRASTRCGLEFVFLAIRDQKKIEQYIAKKQRETIRQMAD